MPNAQKSKVSQTKEKTTLSALLSVVDPKAQTLIIHHMGADCYEAVATGPVRDAQVARCVEACGGCPVEKITVDSDDWPDTPAPVLIITIGREAVT